MSAGDSSPWNQDEIAETNKHAQAQEYSHAPTAQLHRSSDRTPNSSRRSAAIGRGRSAQNRARYQNASRPRSDPLGRAGGRDSDAKRCLRAQCPSVKRTGEVPLDLRNLPPLRADRLRPRRFPALITPETPLKAGARRILAQDSLILSKIAAAAIALRRGRLLPATAKNPSKNSSVIRLTPPSPPAPLPQAGEGSSCWTGTKIMYTRCGCPRRPAAKSPRQ